MEVPVASSASSSRIATLLNRPSKKGAPGLAENPPTEMAKISASSWSRVSIHSLRS